MSGEAAPRTGSSGSAGFSKLLHHLWEPADGRTAPQHRKTGVQQLRGHGENPAAGGRGSPQRSARSPVQARPLPPASRAVYLQPALPNPGTRKRPCGPWAGAQASRRGGSDTCSVPRATLQMEEPWDQPPLTLSGLLGQQGWGCRCSPELGQTAPRPPSWLLNSPQQLPATVLSGRRPQLPGTASTPLPLTAQAPCWKGEGSPCSTV